ncbi:hypothetical protein [Thermodesulfovibrio yellowstonii]|uniref:hypothetical protein n=1 Tax=Thermodesulfovibrio yellowstonii TaxID=28262 RepID=UPI00040615FD|nr:hypothetical protein [Thermodesulfovibrio islandicus]
MRTYFYFLSIFLILIPQLLTAQSQTPYFEKSLDEYNPPLVSDMVPRELLNFKPVSFKFYGGTITELKATTKGGLSRKSDEQEYGKKLHFEWQIKGKLVTLDYYIVSWENAQKYFGGKKVHPNTYTYLKIIDKKIRNVCSGGNCPHLFVESNLPDEHNKCDFYANPDKISPIPFKSNYYIYKQCAMAGGQKFYNIYVGLWSYANVFIEITAYDIDTLKKLGESAVAKLMGKSVPIEQPVEKPKEAQKEQPKQESPKVRVIAMPSAAGDDLWSIAYLPATNKLPAKIIAETKPNTPVTFHIVKSPKDAYLVIGDKKGVTIETKSDSKGIAEALFYYNGGKVTQPKKYEIKVSTGEERDIATVNVGLGLAFDKIKAVQGAYGDRHPFTLSLVSKYFPKLNLGLYFSSASRKVWNGQIVGVRLKPQWVNKTPDLPADMVFNGITKITPVMASSGGNNVLTVLSYSSGEETVYNITKYAYPAVKMMSDGIHNYRIVGELVLTDEEGRDLGGIDESLVQSDALAVVSKDTPEHFMVSLVCALEAQNADQFVMLDYIKRFPVYGKYADEFLNITGILCKLGKEDYEGLFYDLNNYLGGKWLDHLTSKEVFLKLTPRQQKAAKWAKAAFDATQKIKTKREYDEWEVKDPARRSAQSLNPDHDAKKLEYNRELIAPALIDFKEAEEALQKMEEKQPKNKPIEANFNNENLKKIDEQKTQGQGSENTEGNVFEKAVNELKDTFKKIFK